MIKSLMLSLFRNSFDKFNNTGAQMLDCSSYEFILNLRVLNIKFHFHTEQVLIRHRIQRRLI